MNWASEGRFGVTWLSGQDTVLCWNPTLEEDMKRSQIHPFSYPFSTQFEPVPVRDLEAVVHDSTKKRGSRT